MHPAVLLHPERVLVISGPREDLVSSGASTTWPDMVLHLIARYAGATDAQALARLFALQWHDDGLAPYITFEGRVDHGDAEVEAVQRWLATHFSVPSPVDERIRRSGLAKRTFKRRFTAATGLSPITYVQRLRIEEAKRRLERSDTPVDEIGWRVGYEDGAFFRRLFKRTTGLAPGAYRKRFRIPEFARSASGWLARPTCPRCRGRPGAGVGSAPGCGEVQPGVGPRGCVAPAGGAPGPAIGMVGGGVAQRAARTAGTFMSGAVATGTGWMGTARRRHFPAGSR